MPWPQANEFQDAVLNPQLSFLDADLREAEVVCAPNGLPIPASGNFGIVYQMRSAKGRWAVKCFTGDVPGRQERYRKISAHLQSADLPFTVGFDYLEQGVHINGQWYPVLKMDWVEGQTLNQFVGKRLDKPALLGKLAEMWVYVAQLLREKDITHADLQHGNVMLIPAKVEGKVSLKLVDYDGMHLPSLAGTRSGELGHPTYQHPQRLATNYYGPEVDRFAHLVIYTALRAVMVKGRRLWQAYAQAHGDNLLFVQADFKEPAKSAILKELWQDGPDDLRALAGRLVLATARPLAETPHLEDVLDGAAARPLTAEQVAEVRRILVGNQIPLGKLASTPRNDLRWLVESQEPSREAGKTGGVTVPAQATAKAQESSDRNGVLGEAYKKLQRYQRHLMWACSIVGVYLLFNLLCVMFVKRESEKKTGPDNGNPMKKALRDGTKKGTGPNTGNPPEKSVPQVINVGSLQMKFAWIPPGWFLMGSPMEEKERYDNETQHKVTLTKGFFMGVYTVTQGEWKEIMGNDPSSFKGEKNLPVESVSWDDCQEFIKKLREKDKKPYRLPTEAEWEYACRAGTTTPFHFGETISTDQANYDGNYIYGLGQGKGGTNRQKTMPVGSFRANAWGLHDMHGNVLQWCQDWRGEYPQDHVVNPQGPDAGFNRVARGGYWNAAPEFGRSAFRTWGEPGYRTSFHGLRLCFSID